ncbi:MAG: nucleotide sugar dehydrogenase [Candidatus Rokubacteria bacterium]|nr:nucleotide sugar dehydrogenase [Candidatus Rokubacteria bacterium]
MTMERELAGKIETRSATIAVIGQGYVGLPLALEYARAGFTAIGIDNDPDRVAGLNFGQSPTPDVPDAELRELLASGRYRATGDFKALAQSDVVVICVPTPLRKSKDPDISYVIAASEQTAVNFHPGQLVVLESTTYPGTTDELLIPMLAQRGATVGETVFVAFSPERIDPANKQFKVKDIPKVVGGATAACTRMAAALYRTIVPDVYEVSSPTVAELAKLYENTFRNINIALANEFAVMCRKLGVSSKEVVDAAATKPFGFMPFYAGPGIGGHCIAVDPFYLSWKMRLNGYEPRFIHIADEINASMPEYVVEMVADALNERQKSVKGSAVLALGVAYKANVGDTRESPALEILAMLQAKGAQVTYSDPWVPSTPIGDTELKSVELTDQRVADADCVLILADHAAFDYAAIVAQAGLVVDARNATWGLEAPEGRIVRL